MNEKIYIYKSDEDNIFNINKVKYNIPIYQRSYDWEKENIEQLINDINDNVKENNYYLGVLVLSKTKNNKKNYYDVIDGQQRLTTLFLIFNYLGIETKNLNFEYRDKSKKFVEKVDKYVETITQNKPCEIKIEDQNLYSKLEMIHNIFTSNKDNNSLNKDLFKEKLKDIVIVITTLNENMDLNHYFEVMNTRGEQLLQTDIVKSLLMKELQKDDYQLFSEIWEACTDMNSYIQMNFKNSYKNEKLRKKIFSYNWDKFPLNNYDELKEIFKGVNESQPKSYTFNKLLKKENIKEFTVDNNNDYYSIYNTEKGEERFESIIDFRFFLLHVLKVFNKKNNNTELDDMLFENKTIDYFKKVIDGFSNKNKRRMAEDFIFMLLKCRFLFDNYVIKREYLSSKSENGIWSLLKGKKGNTKDGISFDNTYADSSVLKLQSLLRVTYTNPRQMHWITKLLIELINNDKDNGNHIRVFLEDYIKKSLGNINNYLYMGLKTPHLLFNYIDYCIWENDKKKYSKFNFEFRNSVEHFYPQHPENRKMWDTVNKDNKSPERDYIGNLCLVTVSDNSKFSNLAPSSKINEYKENIDSGSLKLRLMRDYLEKTNNNDDQWRTKGYKDCFDEMIKDNKKLSELFNIHDNLKNN